MKSGNRKNFADFRLTELGPLPEEWRVVRLGEVAEITRKPKKLDWPNQIPFIPMEAIPDDGTLYPTKMEWRGREDVRSGVYCEAGDILFAKITPSLENGKQAIAPPQVEFAYATTEVYPLKPSAQVDSLFLFPLLQAPWVREYLAGKMEGSTGRQRLAKSVLLNFPIPLPPLPEQRAIAHVLRAVQEAKEATERVIAAARELKKSLMRHLFTYGPVPVDETDRVPMQETEIGPLPAHWRVVRLGEVTEITRKSKRLDWPNEISFIPMEAIPDDGTLYPTKIEWRGRKNIRSGVYCEAGDILFAKITPSLENGKQAIVPPQVGFAYATTEVYPLKPSPHIDRLFLFSLLQAPWVREHLAGKMEGSTGRQRLAKSVLLNFPIPLPPLAEQHEIARILQSVDEKIRAEEGRKQALEALFKTLLHDLMTAKRRLPEEYVQSFQGGT